MRTRDEMIQQEFEKLIVRAFRLSDDVGQTVDAILREGLEHPLSPAEAAALLAKVIEVLKDGARKRGDRNAIQALEGDINELVRRIMRTSNRRDLDQGAAKAVGNGLQLHAMNGVEPGRVQPRPIFHGREVPVESGFVRTTDIPLWEKNARLDIHIQQFREKFGRGPTPDELLDIMLSRLGLPGVPEKDRADQFAIVGLARSIAINGVRKPPILDRDGTLLDGNRRVAACHYILNSDEFMSDQKRRAEHILVWRLTEHASDEDRDAVVVSLNFEPDHKMDWPEYIKARKVYDDWLGVLALEPRDPSGPRMAELKRQLSMKYALGPDAGVVNRYIKMVEWSDQFQAYNVNERGRDEHEVRHRANKYFQFFDELSRGERRGVAYLLQRDEAFQHLVFDLLFDGKFTEWHQIRPLAVAWENEDARAALQRARDATNVDDARDHLENALAIARMQNADRRELGVNTRIEVFVEWLQEIPLKAFIDGAIKPENLDRLVKSIEKLVAILEKIRSMAKPFSGKVNAKAKSH